MASAAIKGLVSRNRKRFQEGEFDLDLSYITGRVIAMGFPAQNLEAVYRNRMQDVIRFLEQRHRQRYKIYNLCTERQYDAGKFEERVAKYPFDDHQPPRLQLIGPFCEDVTRWLAAHQDNVAAVHCKAGKGRTGVMICAYLVHSGTCATAHQALQHYAERRTLDSKGVTIPSQRRYIHYYALLLHGRLHYQPRPLTLRHVRFSATPHFSGASLAVHFVVTQVNQEVYTSPVHEIRRADQLGTTLHVMGGGLRLVGDVRIEFYRKPLVVSVKKREKLFQFWFNTYFAESVDDGGDAADGGGGDARQYVFDKPDLDKANKDTSHKLFPPHFRVSLRFTEEPAPPPPTSAPPNADGGGGCDGDGDDTYLRPYGGQGLRSAASNASFPLATLQHSDNEGEEDEEGEVNSDENL